MLNFHTEKCETFNDCVDLSWVIRDALSNPNTAHLVNPTDQQWMTDTLAEYDDECETGAADLEAYGE